MRLPEIATRALHLSLQLRHPARLAGRAAKRPDAAVPVADEDRGARTTGDVSDGPIVAPPEHAPGADCVGDDLAGQRRARLAVARRPVQVRLVDDVTVERRRRRDAAMRVELPRALPVLRPDREQHAGVVREEQAAVADRGRELDEALRAERPDALERRRERDAVAEAEMLRVVAVGRPRDARLRRRRRRPPASSRTRPSTSL